LASPLTQTFLNQPISIQTAEDRDNWSVVTLTAQTTDRDYMRSLDDCVKGTSAWIQSQLERQANCTIEGDRVILRANIRHEYLTEDVLPALQSRLASYQGGAMTASAGTAGTGLGTGGTGGGEVTGGTGEEAYEEIRGT
jgi:hypothetical protein